MAWKSPVQDVNCEVIFGNNAEHRADILGANNTVIEVQRSIIDLRDSRERVNFYQNATGRRVVWVVDIQEFWRVRFALSKFPDKDGNYKVSWKPRRTWLWDIAATPSTNLYLEFNQRSDKLLHAWVHEGEMYAKFFTKRDFFMRYLDAVSKPECLGYSDIAEGMLRGTV